MGLRVPQTVDKEDYPLHNPPQKADLSGQSYESPAVHIIPAVSSMSGFELRGINPLNLSKKEKEVLFIRFYQELHTFIIYFLSDAIDEKYGFPIHLKNICDQLIAYHQNNLIIAPRGYSKSTTISGGFPLREICYRKKKYIVIVSETMDIASDFTETIRHELEMNEKIRLFFGNFRSKREKDADSTEKWTIADLICRSEWPLGSGKTAYTRIRSRGLGQQIRGKKFRHQRPDLLIFDDMESRLNTETEHQRQKAKKWFNRDALKIVADFDSETGSGQIVVAGTIVHPESRLNRLKKQNEERIERGDPPLWKMQFYKAADDPKTLKNPLWPERKGYAFLKRERDLAEENDDLAGFVQEFFNEPIAEEDRKFKPIHFTKRYDTVKIENYYGVPTIIHNLKRYPCSLSAGLDIGGSKSDDSDFTGIVIGAVAYDHERKIPQGFVLDAYNERWNYDEIVDALFDISESYSYIDEYRSGQVYSLPWTVETNAFQDAIYHFLNAEMRRRNKWINIANEDHESTRKDSRILSLLPVFKSGYWVFGNHLQWLIQRFLDYGLASDMHDDVEDAFEKMHRGAIPPSEDIYKRLVNIPAYSTQRVVEPGKPFQGNFLTL